MVDSYFASIIMKLNKFEEDDLAAAPLSKTKSQKKGEKKTKIIGNFFLTTLHYFINFFR